MGDQILSRLVFILLAIITLQSQIINRIHKNPQNIFVISDWKIYKGFSSINDVVESNSYIFFATSGAGILRYDKFRDQFTFPLTESNGLISNHISGFITSIADTGIVYKSRIAIKTDRGKQVFELEQQETFRFSDDAGITFKGSNETSKIFAVKGQDNFFLDQPYDYIKPNTVSGPNFQEFKIQGKYIDTRGGVWLFVNNFGFFYSQSASGFFKAIQFGPISDFNSKLVLVNDDVWIAQNSFSNRGLPVISRWGIENDWDHYYEKYSMEINSPFYTNAALHQNSIWFAGKFGLVSYKLKDRTFKDHRFEGLYNTFIHDLTSIGDTLLIGSGQGLYFYSSKTNQISQFRSKLIGNTDVLAVSGNADYIFASTRYSVYKIDRKTRQVSDFKSELPFPNFKTNVIEYIEGKFWFNNSDGIYSYNPVTKEVKQIHLSSQFFTLNVSAIQVQGNTIFLATDRGLLIYVERDDEWVWITKREGLPSNQLTDIIVDGDFLIISSTDGVAEFLWNDPSRKY